MICPNSALRPHAFRFASDSSTEIEKIIHSDGIREALDVVSFWRESNQNAFL